MFAIIFLVSMSVVGFFSGLNYSAHQCEKKGELVNYVNVCKGDVCMVEKHIYKCQ